MPQTIAAAPAAGIEVSPCDNLQAVPGGQEAWNQLVEASTYPNVFRRWEWISIWWKWFGKGRELYLLTLTRGSELVGIAPLYLSRTRLGGRRLAWIGEGGPTCPEYLGPIVHREHAEAVVKAIADHLRDANRHWTEISFPDVPQDDVATRALIDALDREYLTIRTPGIVCPCLDLPDDYELLLQRLSSHGRQRERRQLRKVRNEYNVHLRVSDNVAAVRSSFQTLIALNQSSRGLHRERSPFVNDTYAEFHREVIEALLSEGIARLYLLTFDDRPVAFQYGYLFHAKYYDFQNGFDSRVRGVSPGAVLLQLVFEDLIHLKVKEFDFLRGEEPYKASFAVARRCTESARMFRRAGSGYVAQWIRSNVVTPARHRAKQWLARQG